MISNVIYRKCSIKAAQLEDEFNFPLHFNLPRFSSSENSKK